jgi:hypothetical protein
MRTVLLCYYAASSGNYLLTFRDNLSVTSSRVKNPKGTFGSYGFLNPEGLISDILCGGSLKSCSLNKCWFNRDSSCASVTMECWSFTTNSTCKTTFLKGGCSAVCWYSILNVQPLLTQVCWWPHKGPLRVIFPNSDLRSPCNDDSDETK